MNASCTERVKLFSFFANFIIVFKTRRRDGESWDRRIGKSKENGEEDKKYGKGEEEELGKI